MKCWFQFFNPDITEMLMIYCFLHEKASLILDLINNCVLKQMDIFEYFCDTLFKRNLLPNG